MLWSCRWPIALCRRYGGSKAGLRWFVYSACGRVCLARSIASAFASSRESALSRCVELHRVVKSGAEDPLIIAHLDKLSYVGAKWAFEMQGQKVLGELLHDMCVRGRHEALDRLVADLNGMGYELKGGMRSTVLNSLMARRLWDKAVDYLEEMKQSVPLRHARMYPTLVQGLSESGYLDWAVKYFKEQQSLEMNLQTTKTRSPSLDPLVSLLHASRSDRSPPPSLILNVSPRAGMPSPVLPDEVFQDVLAYIQTWNILLSDGLANAILDFASDSQGGLRTARRMRGAELSGLCARCSDRLTWAPGFEDYPDVTLYVSDYFRRYVQMNKYQDEICAMNGQLNANFYFDYIVDGSNVGLRADSSDAGRRIFRTDLLEAMLNGFHAMGSKVLVVLLHSTLRKGGLKHLAFLDSIASRWTTDDIAFLHLRHFSDDAALVYLAAMSDNERRVSNVTDRVKIVTNDSLANQRFMFKDATRSRFLRWVRQRQCRWSVDCDKRIVLTPGGETVVRTSSGGYHLACEDGSYICL